MRPLPPVPLRTVLPLCLLFLLPLAACGDAGGGEEGSGADSTAVASEEGGEETPARRERPVKVDIATARRGPLVVPVIAEGTLQARREAEIKFELAGRVDRIQVAEGQRVRRGQVLARLDDREYQLALEEARNRYLEALGKIAVEEDALDADGSGQASVEEQLAELERLERAGTITREERRDRELEIGVEAVKQGSYRRELLEVRSGLAAARADEARAELNLDRTVLRAPFDGVVSGLELDPGERVQVGQMLCTVVDDRDLRAEVGVLESDLRALRQGAAALLIVPALAETLQVVADVVQPTVDTNTRTLQVLLRVRSEDGRLKPGMFVKAAIAGEVLQDRLLVPVEAILERDDRPLLFKVDEGRARWVYVALGPRNDRWVEIERVLQGGPLEAGTEVVVGNHLTLTHDAKVEERDRITPADPWAARVAAKQ